MLRLNRLTIVFALVALPALADSAADVVELRQAVATARAELGDARATSRARLTALVSEREELARQLRLEKVKTSTLAALEQERAQAAAGLESRLSVWHQDAVAAVDAVRAVVATTPPVHRTERLETLDRIATELKRPRPDVALALERLWRFLEEEEALGREIAVDKQAFTVGDQTRLLEVAHVGLAVMYARTPEGGYGVVKSNGDIAWVDRDDLKEAIAAIFVGIAKGQRELRLVLFK